MLWFVVISTYTNWILWIFKRSYIGLDSIKNYVFLKQTTWDSIKNCKYFNSYNFNDELKFVFSEENIDSCSKFNPTLLNVLYKNAPLKEKREKP